MGRSLLDRFGTPKVDPSGEKGGKTSIEPRVGLAPTPDNTSTLSEKDWYAIHKLWRSSLFNEYYLKNELKQKKGREMLDYNDGFQRFLEQFRDLCRNRQNEAFKSWKESDTIESWIMPVMQALGWWDTASDPCVREASLTSSDGRTFFLDRLFVQKPTLKKHIQENKGQKQLDYARKYGVLALEAKYWDRIQKYDKGEIGNKDDKARSDVGGKDSPSALSPSGQILAYLRLLKNEDPPRHFFGIVTDGRTWRLHHVNFPEDTFYEFDLGGLLFQLKSNRGDIEEAFQKDPKSYVWYVEAAKYFYYFFSKDVLFKDNEPTFVDDVLRHRQQYVDRAEEDLRSRFIDAMKFACNGLDRSAKKEGIKLEMGELRNLAESHLFNLLFIKSCEARGVLPLYTNYKEKSLTYIVERLRQFDPSLSDADNEDPILKRAFGDGYKNSATDLYDHVIALAKHIEDGASKISDYELVGFKQSVFSEKEKSLRHRLKLTNIEMVRALFALGYLHEDRIWKQIPYNIFTTRQLGSIYESLLEFKLETATEDLEFVKGQWKPVGKASREKMKSNEEVGHPIAYKGELFFTPDNSERKITGSYYTPDHVVQYMLANTLEPTLKGKTSEQIASIRIVDPAAGSGHFLNAALSLLTKHYLETLHEERGPSALTTPEATRFLLDKCVFGVDINPRAIKLAKMGLWLESAQSTAPLENLDDQLVCGNALVDDMSGYEKNFSWEKNIFKPKKFEGFDVVIGNPPYIDSEGMVNSGLGPIRDYISSNYNWAKGNWDIYIAFFELGFRILNDHGSLALITPDKWLSKPFGAELRSKTIENIYAIANAGRGVFEDSKVDAIISFFGRTKTTHLKIATIDRSHVDSKREIVKATLKPPYAFDGLFSNYLGLMLKIEKHKSKISDLSECENACATSDCYKLQPLVRNQTSKEGSGAEDFKVINTGTIDKYVSRWGVREMTYLKNKYLRPVVNKRRFLREFPNSYSQKSQLPKIIIKGLTLLDGCLDRDGSVIPGKSTLVITSEKVPVLKLLLAIINSKLAFFYIKEKYPASSYNQGINFTKDMINSLPVPEMNEGQKKELVGLVEKILATAESTDYHSNSKKQEKVKQLAATIDQTVYRIYGLSQEDISLIENAPRRLGDKEHRDKAGASKVER